MKRELIVPVLTEKTSSLAEQNKYVFYVGLDANKIYIRQLVEKKFGVEVDKVSTLNVRGKLRRRGRVVGRTANKKKAVVTLKKGFKIELE